MSSLSCLRWLDLETRNKMTIRDRWLFIAGAGGEDFFGGDHLILGEQKWGSVVTENPKEGITQICLESEESHQMLLGEITSVK